MRLDSVENRLYVAVCRMEGRAQAASLEAGRALKRGDPATGYRFLRLSVLRAKASERLFEWEQLAHRAERSP